MVLFNNWLDKYQTEKVIDLNIDFSTKERKFIEKLIKKSMDWNLTGEEYEILKLKLFEYSLDDDSEDDIEESKSLDNTDIEDYKKIMKKFKRLDCKYNNVLRPKFE